MACSLEILLSLLEVGSPLPTGLGWSGAGGMLDDETGGGCAMLRAVRGNLVETGLMLGLNQICSNLTMHNTG